MKKTISGVLLALTAVFALAGCKKSGSKATISFYCWNDEFKTRLNELYPEVKKAEGSKTTLKNGIVINWVQSPNQSAVYQNSLDVALENNLVDMFCFEADYATKYVKSNYVAKMADLGLTKDGALKNQYKYTQDIVTNQNGDIVGSSWQGTPGIIVYNEAVAKAVFGDTVTYEQMDAKLSTDFDTFKTTAAAVEDAGKYTLIGTDDWFRTYQNNLSAKMWDGTNITLDKQLFQWAKDTKEFQEAGYIFSVADGYGLWGEAWGQEQGKDNVLTVFSCPWFTDFCLNGNRTPDANGSLGMKAVKGYKSWFWGGTWLTATKNAAEDAAKKDTVKDIIEKMTANTEILKKLAIKYGDFTNDKPAMEALAKSEEGNSALFGGQNVTAIYAASVEKADLSKNSDYDQQICENMQNSFRTFFRGTKTAEECLAALKTALTEATSVKAENIKLAEGVTVSGNTITIA
jgi:hypothetical protein